MHSSEFGAIMQPNEKIAYQEADCSEISNVIDTTTDLHQDTKKQLVIEKKVKMMSNHVARTLK